MSSQKSALPSKVAKPFTSATLPRSVGSSGPKIPRLRNASASTSSLPKVNESQKSEIPPQPSAMPKKSGNKDTPVSRPALNKIKPKGPSSIFHQERHSVGSPALTRTPTRPLIRGSDVSVRVSTPEIYTAVRFEQQQRKQLYSELGAGIEKANLIVAVRVRPQTFKEERDKEMKQCVNVRNNEVSVETEYGQTHNFTYDHCFSCCDAENEQFGGQETVYSKLAKPLLAKAFEGFNTCLFAYGQTGSGKSYSIMGNIGSNESLDEKAGVVPRFCFDLFRNIESASLRCKSDNIEVQISYFEIYKEKIQDLLSPAKTSLRVREHPQTGPYVVDLSNHAVNSFEDVRRWLLVGNRQRATAATSANERSSRSHAIFTVTLSQRHLEKVEGQSHESHRQSRINFIDLAGSERVASVNSTGERREEGLTINQSLLTLGRVITALAEHNFVPYRESVLTWLLKESLGGDSKTVMLATVSPCGGHVEETLSTLRYACQARTIVNTARICEDPNARLVRNLRQQIEILEQRVQGTGDVRVSVEAVVSGSHAVGFSQQQRVTELEDEIERLKRRLSDTIRSNDTSWKEKVAEAEKKRIEAEQALSNYGLSNCMDQFQACLVNVNQDPLLSGTLFFPLKQGSNWIGRTACSANPPEIQLSGLMIEEQHCCIESVDGDLTLTSLAETYVNGQLVTSPVRLHHADRVIIAGTHYFHLHNPKDSGDSRKNLVDFQTAYEELRRVQEGRLQAAVLEAQEKTRKQLLVEMEELRNEAALEMSLQRHSYEDEIASLSRALELRQQQQEDVIDSPASPLLVTPTARSIAMCEIDAFFQDTNRKLEKQSVQCEQQSPFFVQTRLNEANVICRRLRAPYSFSRKETLDDDSLGPAVCVHDRSRNLFIKWSVAKLNEKLEILREAAEDDLPFPIDAVFDSEQDAWQVEEENQSFVVPYVRDRLENVLKRHDCNLTDDSRLSLDSTTRRRSSILLRSPPSNPASVYVETCRDSLLTIPQQGGIFSVVCNAVTQLGGMLINAERSALLAVRLTPVAYNILTVLPLLAQQEASDPQCHPNAKFDWLQLCSELCRKLQNATGYLLQAIQLECSGLFQDWIQQMKESVHSIELFLCELAVIYHDTLPEFGDISVGSALIGFRAGQNRIHQSLLQLVEEVRLRIEQIPDDDLSEAINLSGSSFNKSGLEKACHDCVVQVLVVLEKCSPLIAKCDLDGVDLIDLHTRFHQRVTTLLQLASTLDDFLVYLKNANLPEIKQAAADLEMLTISYVTHVSRTGDIFIGDLTYSASIIQKIVAERKRMIALRRGRDVNYGPVPARLLASPSVANKRAYQFDESEPDCLSSDECEESGEDDDSIESPLSPSTIERALRFQTPVKSSLRMAGELVRQVGRSVRFNVPDSPSKSVSPTTTSVTP